MGSGYFCDPRSNKTISGIAMEITVEQASFYAVLGIGRQLSCRVTAQFVGR
jgi:hypothetical protein